VAFDQRHHHRVPWSVMTSRKPCRSMSRPTISRDRTVAFHLDLCHLGIDAKQNSSTRCGSPVQPRWPRRCGLISCLQDPPARIRDSQPRHVSLALLPALGGRQPSINEFGDESDREAVLFPEWKPLEFLTERRTLSKASWESLYQQNPIIVGGGRERVSRRFRHRGAPRSSSASHASCIIALALVSLPPFCLPRH
jgi:hypothetical protein